MLFASAAIASLAIGIQLISSGALAGGIEDVQADSRPRGPVSHSPAPPRDIAILMLDGFPGDAAAELAARAGSGYDPTSFPDALAEIGFDVHRDAHASYLLTSQTLASMFSMSHVDSIAALGDSVGSDREDRALRLAISRGAAMDVLHQAGYEIVWIDSGFADVETRRVDRWVDVGTPSEFEVLLLSVTSAGDLLNAFAPDLLSELQRQRTTAILEVFVRVMNEPHTAPRFVFAHLPSPHAPWVFGPNGEPIRESLDAFYSDPPGRRGIDRDTAIRRAFGQAEFVGVQAAAVLEQVTARPDPPVVVVFSDHGPGTGMNFLDPRKSDLRERSSNFLATYSPGAPKAFDGLKTPANIFPKLFQAYLGQAFPPLSDGLFIWDASKLDPFEVPVPTDRP